MFDAIEAEKRDGAELGASPVRLSISDVKWEYEDELPEMEDDDYDAIFPASKVVGNEWGGVRMFPYVVDDDGNRTWISCLPNGADDGQLPGGKP